MRRLILLIAVPWLASSLLWPVGSATAAAPTELPMYKVTQTGLMTDQAKALADALGVPMALAGDGSFQFTSDKLADVPMMKADPGDLPRDEGGMDTVPMAFDIPAIKRLQPIATDEAQKRVLGAFSQAGVPIPDGTKLMGSHTTLKLQSIDGRQVLSKGIDTSVRFQFMLGQQTLIGPGAKGGVSFDPLGGVTEFNWAGRSLEMGDMVPLIRPAAANRECAMHYPVESRLAAPRLIYWAPPLSWPVMGIYPHYQCQGTGPQGEQLVPAVVPAVAGITPKAKIDATTDGTHVDATVQVRGGTAPFTFSWQSLSTLLGPRASDGRSVSYDLKPREPISAEVLWVTVVDANGLAGTAMVELPIGPVATPGTTRSRPLTVTRLDVGGEFNVYEWQCVKDSVSGFTSVFNGHSIPIQFKWTGTNAWERDFRETSAPQNGDDSNWVDDVDLAWYTGHGNPNSFTFDNTTHDDGSIVLADGRWGNRDLEWLQLESCNVLQFDSGGTLIWDRWAQTFDGIHLLNGFQTTASCVAYSPNVFFPGGTSGRFSFYLFPETIGPVSIPALKVRQAWAQMAKDLEPAGKQYVSMGPVGSGGITNFDDYFWGQGPVGPDIPRSQITMYWWLGATV